MIISIIQTQTKKEYRIDILNFNGENTQPCPVCSHESFSFKFKDSKGYGQCFRASCSSAFVLKQEKQFEKCIKPSKEKNTFLYRYFKKRKISEVVVDFMNITTQNYKFKINDKFQSKQAVCFNYYNNDGKCTFVHYKSRDKDYSSSGILTFYNINALSNQQKDGSIIITEGEEDALSFIEVGLTNVISFPGAKTRSLMGKHSELFSSVSTVYIAVDNDKEGEVLKESILKQFPDKLCYIISFKDCKDANETLVKYGKQVLIDCYNNAVLPDIDGFDELDEDTFLYPEKYTSEYGTTTYYPDIDERFKWRKRDIILWTGFTQSGKSNLLLSLMVVKSLKEDYKWAVFSPEYSTKGDFYIHAGQILLGKCLDKRSWNTNYEDNIERKKYAEKFIREHFFYINSTKSSHTLDFILTTTKALIKTKGIDGILIDPYNQLDKVYQSGIYESIVEYGSTIKAFAKKYNVIISTIEHLKSIPANRRNNTPTLDDINGGRMWSNKMDHVLFLTRDQQEDGTYDNNRVTLTVRKIKDWEKVGKTGQVSLVYEQNEYRYFELGGFCPLSLDAKRQTVRSQRRKL